MYNIAHKGVPSSCAVLTDSIMSDSATPWTEPTRLFCSGDSPGKNTEGSGLPCPSPGDLSNPGIKPRSPALQADSLPGEPQGKPKKSGAGSLSFLQGIFPTQELNWSLLHCRWIPY